jgi:hypothetical protein
VNLVLVSYVAVGAAMFWKGVDVVDAVPDAFARM